ncbi:MAG: type VI secretion system contractile sheath large subunit [Desulfovibrio sp.]|nr:type VI secretion system contractile sheath large subunit [Desulfovibrio sp.]MBI4959104.1 type VI secretion system contractile sheath large subunit [Desulfovibrio sp.]
MPSVQPFTILALAPFAPVAAQGYKPRVVETDLYTLDDALAQMAPRFWVELSKDVCPEAGLDVAVSSLSGFKPENVVKNTPYLADLDACRSYLAQARASGAQPDKAAADIRAQWPGLPLDLSIAQAAQQETADTGAIDDILSMVAVDGAPSQASGGSGLAGWQAQVETLVARAVAGIFADPNFRLYESAWRGAECLARKAGLKEGGRVRLKLCSVSPENLADALGALAVELIEDTPHLTVIDHGFDNSPASIELLEQVLAFADTLLAPVVAELSMTFFRIGAWRELSKLGYLKSALEDAQFVKFRKLRDHPGASRLMLTLNRFLTRAPYGPGNPARPVVFTEESPLWLSPCWGVATLAAKSVAAYGWPSRLADYRTVFVEELAVADSGDGPAATEGLFDENRIAELMEAGISPLVGGRGKDVTMLPRQTSLDGGSFVFQLFFGRIVSHLLQTRESSPDAVQEDPAAMVTRALLNLFNQTDQVPPADLTVTAGEEKDGRVPLTISFTPPRAVMGGERLTFGFGW